MIRAALGLCSHITCLSALQRRDVRRAQLEQQYQQRMALTPGPRGPMGAPGMFPPGEPTTVRVKKNILSVFYSLRV